MITDKQSLILCGILVAGMFLAGILNILKHHMVLTVLSVIFLVIILNLFLSNCTPKK